MTLKLIKTEMSCPECGEHSVHTDLAESPTFSCSKCSFRMSLDFSKNKENKEVSNGEV